MIGRFKYTDVPYETIVQRARILVIDDQEFPYLRLFRRDGYSIEKWNDVTQLHKIESEFYDLILLDLQGVGRSIAGSDEGLGVLKHIKSVRPFQLVLAYSNAEFQLQYQPFFKLADGVLAKTSDYIEFKQQVDKLLRDHFSYGFQMRRVEEYVDLSGAPLARGMRRARRSMASKDTEPIRTFMRKYRVDPPTVDRTIRLLELTFKMVDLWKK